MTVTNISGSYDGRTWILIGLTMLVGMPGGGTGIVLAGSPSEGDDLFRLGAGCRIQIELRAESVQSLRVYSRQDVPATVRIAGEVLRDVGVHLKGTGSFRPVDDKPSFTLTFDRFAPGQRLQGLRKVHLNNSVEDPTYLKEQLASELFRMAGVPAPRVGHALVELDGRRLGVYVLKEGFTDEFIARYFARPGGNLYDTDRTHDIDQPMKRHLGKGSDEPQVDLQRLAAAAAEPDLDRRWQDLHQRLDMEQFMTFIAMEILVCHWDGYCLARNNFRIYHDLATDKITLLPAGMDQVFSKADLTWQPDMSGLLARAVLEVPEGRQRYAARFKELLGQVLVSNHLTNRVSQLLAGVQPLLRKTELEEAQVETAELCARITKRESYLKMQLSQPEPPFPEFNQDTASLGGWQGFDRPLEGRMEEGKDPDGEAVLGILADSNTSASWRTTVRLPHGRYRFCGEAKTSGVRPLPFGRNQGASLRVSGATPHSAALTGSSSWTALDTPFEVSGADELVVLVCELRAAGGEVRFRRNSLKLIQDSPTGVR